MNELWGTYVPNWITAISTALALGAAAVAALFAWRSLKRESQREERGRAAGLSAWWVTGAWEGRTVWGIVISNVAPTVFHDIAIQAVGNTHPKSRNLVEFRTLPPGQYFVESLPYSEPRAWGPKRVLDDLRGLQPLTDGDKRLVTEINYTDSGACRWRWSPHEGLAFVRRGAVSGVVR